MGLDITISKEVVEEKEILRYRKSFWIHNYFLSVSGDNPSNFYSNGDVKITKKILKDLIKRCEKFIALSHKRNSSTKLWEESNKLFCFNPKMDKKYVEEAYGHYWKCKPESSWVGEMEEFISEMSKELAKMNNKTVIRYGAWG